MENSEDNSGLHILLLIITLVTVILPNMFLLYIILKMSVLRCHGLYWLFMAAAFFNIVMVVTQGLLGIRFEAAYDWTYEFGGCFAATYISNGLVTFQLVIVICMTRHVIWTLCKWWN